MKDEKEMTAQELEQVNGGVHSPKLFSPLLNKESQNDENRIVIDIPAPPCSVAGPYMMDNFNQNEMKVSKFESPFKASDK